MLYSDEVSSREGEYNGTSEECVAEVATIDELSGDETHRRYQKQLG